MPERKDLAGLKVGVHYYAYFVQRGEGCDYTIACGKLLKPLKASTWVEAEEEVRRFLLGGNPMGEYDPEKHESLMEEVRVIEAMETREFDVDDFYDLCAEAVSRRKAAEKEAAELLELERLQKKHGKKS